MVVVVWGGITWNFHKQRGGTNNFSAASRGGDQKFSRVFHPVSTTHPRELKNDNSLSLRKYTRGNISESESGNLARQADVEKIADMTFWASWGKSSNSAKVEIELLMAAKMVAMLLFLNQLLILKYTILFLTAKWMMLDLSYCYCLDWNKRKKQRTGQIQEKHKTAAVLKRLNEPRPAAYIQTFYKLKERCSYWPSIRRPRITWAWVLRSQN